MRKFLFFLSLFFGFLFLGLYLNKENTNEPVVHTQEKTEMVVKESKVEPKEKAKKKQEVKESVEESKIIESEVEYIEEEIEYVEEYTEEPVYQESAVEEVVEEEIYEEYEYIEESQPVIDEYIYENNEEDSVTEYSVGDFQATAYAIGEVSVPSTTTADGTDISNTIYSPEGYRIIAVDPSIIPMGSIVTVEMPSGESFLAKASDTGGAINGNIIDILVGSIDEADSFGRQHGIKIYMN